MATIRSFRSCSAGMALHTNLTRESPSMLVGRIMITRRG